MGISLTICYLFKDRKLGRENFPFFKICLFALRSVYVWRGRVLKELEGPQELLRKLGG